MKKRTTANLEALEKIHRRHELLLMEKGFAEYEKYQQELRESYWNMSPPVDPSCPEALASQCWPALASLIKLPSQPSKEEYQELVWGDRTFELVETLDKIHNVYTVLDRSIDFAGVSVKRIDDLLKSLANNTPQAEFLTREEEKYYHSLVFDIEHWDVEENEDSDTHQSIPEVYLLVQRELRESGTLSDTGKELLVGLRQLRAGLNRPRTYSEGALIAMLADFFEEHNEFGAKANIQQNPSQLSKTEYEAMPDLDEQGRPKEWRPEYQSRFFEFLVGFEGSFDLPELSYANAQKLLRNRRKLKTKGILKLCGINSSGMDFKKLFQTLDKIKA